MTSLGILSHHSVAHAVRSSLLRFRWNRLWLCPLLRLLSLSTTEKRLALSMHPPVSYLHPLT